MADVEVISFRDALADAARANFASLSPAARAAFAALDTEDFERVIKTLKDAAKLLPLYSIDPAKAAALEKDAEGLKEVLVQTIADSHPARPGDITEAEYGACRAFLANFNTVYTMNYDLLLYWAQMHTEENKRPDSDDGFRKPEDELDADYVVWDPSQSHGQNTWFLHGALHVFDAGTEVQKFTWVNTGIALIDQIRDALGRGYFPLFVAEGTSAEKLERIRHSDYLAKAYRSFQEIGGALFTFGHSFAENDEHYLKRIERGKVRYLYVGIHGDRSSPGNQQVIKRARAMPLARPLRRPLDVLFYDSDSAKVWG